MTGLINNRVSTKYPFDECHQHPSGIREQAKQVTFSNHDRLASMVGIEPFNTFHYLLS